MMNNEERRKATEWFRNRAKNCPMSGSRRMYEIATEALEERERNEQPHWIPVTERLPDHHGHYLAHIIAGEYQQVSWDEIAYFDGNAFQWEHSSEEYPEKLTHWMPLPEPPEKESES